MDRTPSCMLMDFEKRIVGKEKEIKLILYKCIF